MEMSDIAAIIAVFICFLLLSLMLAGWIMVERKTMRSDTPTVLRFFAVLIVFPLWLIAIADMGILIKALWKLI